MAEPNGLGHGPDQSVFRFGPRGAEHAASQFPCGFADHSGRLPLQTAAGYAGPLYASHATLDLTEILLADMARLEKEDNPQGWVMLARSYKMLERYDEAAKAYGRAGAFIDNEPALLADYADILVAGSGTFVGKPRELIAKALKLDPDHIHALWLSGTAAFEAGQYKQAIAEWERLQMQLPPGSEEAQAVEASLAEARDKAGIAKPAAKAEDKHEFSR